ncbi:MAG: hypothetical protein E4H10_04860 [Bacteroidia bacterium]|nr:MAG: hypothetical protein E4H10_04860 [Bacteroidia bacterium]
MASIRILKKDINRLAFNLLQDCFAYRHYSSDLSEDRFDDVIRKVVLLRNDLILRTNHPEADADSPTLKEHYKQVQLDLIKLLEVVDDLKK